MDNLFMQEACRLAAENVQTGKGGPFGAVIVKNGKIIAGGANHVTTTNDPTAHAEVVAIREACKILGDFQLTDCELYTSCEPCPMCLGAIYWARPAMVYYMHTAKEAAAIGFDDQFIYDELKLPLGGRKTPFIHVEIQPEPDAFKLWQEKEDKVKY